VGLAREVLQDDKQRACWPKVARLIGRDYPSGWLVRTVSQAGRIGEMQNRDYARRSRRWNVTGRGFDSRRLQFRLHSETVSLAMQAAGHHQRPASLSACGQRLSVRPSVPLPSHLIGLTCPFPSPFSPFFSLFGRRISDLSDSPQVSPMRRKWLAG